MAESIRLSKELCETIRQEGIARRIKAEQVNADAKENAAPLEKAKEATKSLPGVIRSLFQDRKQ